ncbi:SRSO17 transposase [Thermobifida halotolerans]
MGLQRQYTGTAGRVENARVAVYLAYATRAGHALIDHRLHLPASCTDDPDRLPDHVGFATQPQWAGEMITDALDAGTPARWVAADEVYGQNPRLRRELEQRRLGYVPAVPRRERLGLAGGPATAADLAALVPRRAWQRLPAGTGAKGQRCHDWAPVDAEPAPEGHRWALIRRHRATGELAFYRCYAPDPVPLSRLVAVAGRRWAVEECFQQGRGLAGLDGHQVRTWCPWHRWSLFAVLAYAFLAVLAAADRHQNPTTSTLTALTCNEIHHLFNTLFAVPPDPGRLAGWSLFRRRHQARARQCHHRRQATREP